MLNHICLLNFALAELFHQTSRSGQITVADQYGLLAALLSERLTEEEGAAIDRLLHAVSKGHVKIVDQLSIETDRFWSNVSFARSFAHSADLLPTTVAESHVDAWAASAV